MKNKLIIILHSADEDKINYALGILATAASLDRDTELFLTGKAIMSFLEKDSKTKLNNTNSNELLKSIIELKTKISVCSGALHQNIIEVSELRKDISFNISGLTSILNQKNSRDQIIFI